MNYSVYKWTGVEELHKAGIFGKGATVATVDTGVNYNHPVVSISQTPVIVRYIYDNNLALDLVLVINR